jgi:hypothetical protein
MAKKLGDAIESSKCGPLDELSERSRRNILLAKAALRLAGAGLPDKQATVFWHTLKGRDSEGVYSRLRGSCLTNFNPLNRNPLRHVLLKSADFTALKLNTWPITLYLAAANRTH